MVSVVLNMDSDAMNATYAAVCFWWEHRLFIGSYLNILALTKVKRGNFSFVKHMEHLFLVP